MRGLYLRGIERFGRRVRGPQLEIAPVCSNRVVREAFLCPNVRDEVVYPFARVLRSDFEGAFFFDVTATA